MAREIGIDTGFFNRIIRGNANPGNKFYVGLAALCKRYNLKFEEFFDIENIPSSLNKGNVIHFECPSCGAKHDIDIRSASNY